MDPSRQEASYPNAVLDVVAEATGRAHRDDPARGRSGGPAGNARLTAWTGLILLGLLAVEGGTLVSIGQLLGVHILVGTLLVPPVLLKSATTGWRILRYYTGDRDYVHAGPPPLFLRLLGPLVIATSLAVLGTGLALIALGSDSLTRSFAGLQLSMLTLHKASFFLWFVVMTAHVLSRTVPALRIISARETRSESVRGGASRLITLVLTLAVGVAVGVAVLGASSWWTTSWQR